MGEMNIDIKSDAKLVKKCMYKLAQNYKDIVKKEIENVLEEESSILYISQNGIDLWSYNQIKMF